MIVARIVVIAALAAPAVAQERAPLSDAAFVRALQRLGLTDLLERHLERHPPRDQVEAALLRRSMRLAVHADATRPTPERMAAAHDATAILTELIAAHPDHADRPLWRLDRARDLIDRHAEPYYNTVLFRNAAPADRAVLAQIASEALSVYDGLISDIEAHLNRIEDLPAREFERLAQSGALDRLERLLPQARYLRQWASFYNCLALEPAVPEREPALRAIVAFLGGDSDLLRTPHATSHYQAQSLLLAGMAHRLLAEDRQAEVRLSAAGDVVSRIADADERRALDWVRWMAHFERLKNLRDARRFDDASHLADRIRRQLDSEPTQQFHLRFTLALLQRSVHESQANYMPARLEARRVELEHQAQQPLIDLVSRFPRYRNEIYQAIYEALDPDAGVDALDAFERAVMAARLIQEASRAHGAAAAGVREKLLARAERLATAVLDDESPLATQLHAEAHFNLAVCFHEQGQTLSAIEQFNELTAHFPDFERHAQATDLAVRLAENLYHVARDDGRDIIRPAYAAALGQLLSAYPDTDGARSRRYTYAVVLDELGDHAGAITWYDRVSPMDVHAAAARSRAARCRLEGARRMEPGAERIRWIEDAARRATAFRDAGHSDESAKVAGMWLVSAETALLTAPPAPARALQYLDGFDRLGLADGDLQGQGLRLRILAFEAEGRPGDAAAIIPLYVERDPHHAGATLQGLLRRLRDEVAAARRRGDHAAALGHATGAAAVAEELAAWAARPEARLSAEDQLALQLAHAEALLETARVTDARTAIDILRPMVTPPRSANGRVLYALARAHHAVGEPAAALPLFSRLHRQSAEDTAMWWDTLYAELRCRMELDQDPQILYNLIEQKRAFYRHLGGPERKPRFLKLQSELRNRTTSS